jgi:hypothetical protein
MVRTSLIAAAILLMLPSAQSADPPSTLAKTAPKAKSKAPTSTPPRWARVRMDDDERIRVREYIVVPVYRVVEKQQADVDTGERSVTPHAELKYESRESVYFVALDDVVAMTAAGKKILPYELARLLEKDTAAMVSDAAVDPYYLTTIKEDALILHSPGIRTHAVRPEAIGGAQPVPYHPAPPIVPYAPPSGPPPATAPVEAPTFTPAPPQ